MNVSIGDTETLLVLAPTEVDHTLSRLPPLLLCGIELGSQNLTVDDCTPHACSFALSIFALRIACMSGFQWEAGSALLRGGWLMVPDTQTGRGRLGVTRCGVGCVADVDDTETACAIGSEVLTVEVAARSDDLRSAGKNAWNIEQRSG
jgi:hypothetical protein